MDSSSGANIASGANVSISISANIKSAEEGINKLVQDIEKLRKTAGSLDVNGSITNTGLSANSGFNDNVQLEKRLKLLKDIDAQQKKMGVSINQQQTQSLIDAQANRALSARLNAERRYAESQDPVAREDAKMIKMADAGTRAKNAELRAESIKIKQQTEDRKDKELKVKQDAESRRREQFEYKKEEARKKEEAKKKKEKDAEGVGLTDYISMLSDISTMTGVDTSGIAKLLRKFSATQRLSSKAEKMAGIANGAGEAGNAANAAKLAGLVGSIGKVMLIIKTLQKVMQFLYGQGKIGYDTQLKINNALKTVDKASLDTADSLERLRKSSMSLVDSLEFIGKASKMYISQGVSTERGTEIGNRVLAMSQDIASTYRYVEKPESIAEKISSDIQTGGSSAAEYGIRVSDNYIKSWALATKGVDLYHTKVSEAYMVQLRFEKALEDAGVYAGNYEKNVGNVSDASYKSISMLNSALENLRHELEPVYALIKNTGSLFTAFAAKFVNALASGVDFLNDMFNLQIDVGDGLSSIESETDTLLRKQENLNAAYAAWSDYLDRIQKDLFGFEDLTVMANIQEVSEDLPEGVSAKLSTELDDKTTKQDVKDLVKSINQQLGKVEDVEIVADIDDATGKVKGFSVIVTDIEGKTVTIDAELEHEMEVEEFERLINDYLPNDKQITIDAETGVAMDNLGNVANIMDGLIEKTGSYEKATESLQSLLAEFTDITASIDITTSGLGLTEILSIKYALDSLSDKTVTVDFVYDIVSKKSTGSGGSGGIGSSSGSDNVDSGFLANMKEALTMDLKNLPNSSKELAKKIMGENWFDFLGDISGINKILSITSGGYAESNPKNSSSTAGYSSGDINKRLAPDVSDNRGGYNSVTINNNGLVIGESATYQGGVRSIFDDINSGSWHGGTARMG